MGVVGPSYRHLRKQGMLYNNSNELSKTSVVIEEKFDFKEVNNMKWEKVSIVDAIGKNVFLDNYGVARIYIKEVTVNTNYGIIGVGALYEEGNDKSYYNKIKNCESVNFIKKEQWDSKTYFLRDPSSRVNYYYNNYNGNDLNKNCAKEVKIKSLNIKFSINYKNVFSSNLSEIGKEIILEFNNKKEMEDYTVWMSENFSSTSLRRPIFTEIKVDDLYYYVSSGLVKVVKVYEYPNKRDFICDIETKSGGILTISTSSFENFCYLPYENIQSKFIILDKCNNETSLMPYVTLEGQTYNVYWKEIENAENYIVSLYKIIDVNKTKDLYHVNDYILERNEKMLVVSGLVGCGFVFKVSAEDRSGIKIAESRGILDKGFPKYFVD